MAVNKRMKWFLALTTVLLLIPFAVAIDAFLCTPNPVLEGASITCTADLAIGATERNVAWNMTFYNDTAQTLVINSCAFNGTTADVNNPPDIVQSCGIPSTYGASTTAVANFTLSTGSSSIYQFNISEETASDLLINSISVENPCFIGDVCGVSAKVSKADTGLSVIGASCVGDILQSQGANLVP